MEKSYSESYAAAGVDITAGYRSVELMKQYVARTMNEHCIGGLGGFGGLFELDCTGYKHPVLISGTDGVGTKLKIAMIMDKHDTIGIDCVAMCVNDVICAGAKPLVFLDYIACGRNIPEKIAEIVKGVAEGCVQADCSLVGGETAEHPGMMPEEEYDLAGFTVGVVDKEKILSNETMAAGDVILALPSTGVHSNGFSLVRKIFDIDANPDVLHTAPAELGGKTLGEALLAPTKIYVEPVLKVLEEVDVKGISHITGGGTNLQALLDSEARGENPNGRITLVVASKPGVYALERAAKAGVEGCVVRRKDYASSEDFDAALLKTLKDHNIDLVVLAGFLSVLGPSVIEAYPRRILNVHPALIPSFCGPGMYGLRPHEAALARGCKVTGATVHFVNEECDGGPILLQKAVDILPGDTPEVLQKRVMEQAEWKLLPKAVAMVCSGEIE